MGPEQIGTDPLDVHRTSDVLPLALGAGEILDELARANDSLLAAEAAWAEAAFETRLVRVPD